MAETVTLDGLDLAALLCSRVCHDLISPVGAVVNGMEVLEETNDEGTKTFALDLIKRSAAQASARLQFCRMAFGAAGSAGAEIDLGEAEAVARGFIEDEKVALSWLLARVLMPKNRVKLLLNMLVLAGNAVPRGGTVTVEEAEGGGFRITSAGAHARVQAAVPALIAGTPEGNVDAHGIQPFYAGLLARACGFNLTVDIQPEKIVLLAN